ncbi:MAG: peptidyl-prolyl cis-trans isomerase [Actinomycetota bacterium]
MGTLPGARRRGSAALLFVGLAATALFTSGCGEKPVATVNGQSLSEKEFHQLTETATRIEPQRGTVGLQTLSQWINSSVMEQEAKKLKVYPSEKELDARVDAFRRQAALRGSNLEEQLKSQGVNFETFKDELLKQLVNENILFNGVTVSDAELEEEWKKKKPLFVQPETVKLSQITVDSPDALKKTQADLAGNTDFALVARTRSQDQFKDAGGAIPEPLPKQLPPGGPVAKEVLDAAFKLKPGQVSDPIKVGATWVIVKLEEKIAEKQPNFDDFKELMRSNMRQQKAQGNGKLQENQQALVKAQQAAKVEINRPEYAALAAQTGGGAPGVPGAGGPPPAPPQ